MLPGQIRGKWSSFSKGRRINNIETELNRYQKELQDAQAHVDELKSERDQAVAEQDVNTSGAGGADQSNDE
jgi:predicted RNase H-like nuclease (RuvC/YqgF family)